MRRVLLLLLMFVFAAVMTAAAHADVMISPIYVIFDGHTRSAEVTLLNTTNETGLYRLEWTLTRQKEDGSYEYLKDLPAGTIDPRTFVRFSPRQVLLLPQGKQLVRIQLQKPADLPDGEYRLHLAFRMLPREDPPSADPQARGMKMQLKVTLGVVMPVVIRQGDYDAHPEIADARFVKRKGPKGDEVPQLMVRVNRTGKHGTYGRLRVFWQHDGNETQVGALNNFSVYADNPSRVGYVALTTNDLPAGRLRIVYEGDGPQRGKVLTERLISIGG